MSDETLFDDQLLMWEAVFNGEPGTLLPICKGQSVLVSPEDVEMIIQQKWWRERTQSICYFRTDEPWYGIPRPELHRIVAGIRDSNIRVKFRNGCCFDCRRENLTPSIWEKK